MALSNLSVRLIGITAVCLVAALAPVTGPERLMALAAFSLGVALASVMPGYDRWAAWIVGPSVLLLALAPPAGLWGLAALVALCLIGFACFSFAGMERAVPALGLPLFTFAFRRDTALPLPLLCAWVAAVVAMVVLANRASPVGWGAWLGDDEAGPLDPAAPSGSADGAAALPPAPTGGVDHRLVFSRRRTIQALAVVVLVVPVAVGAAHALASVMPAPGTAGGSHGGGGRVASHPGLTGGLDTGLPVNLSDDVVLRVRAERPRYWRGATYDEWDGRRWRASGPTRTVTWASEVLLLDPGAGDPAADAGSGAGDGSAGGAPVVRERQEFTAVAGGLDVLVAAWRPVELEAGVRSATVGDDGSIQLGAPLEAGVTWRVVSEVVDPSADDLRRADPGQLPAGSAVLARYASEGDVDPEVAELARTIAAGAGPTAYDRIRALEAWMAANITYSRDIPVLPEGRDAVHELLFASRRGFCEQIGTAMVVMLRSLGVPARLAVGYVPGERDASTGEWVSRASDAHAWAEVYFPGIGWQGFDPTASVPLDPGGAPPEPARAGGVPGWLPGLGWPGRATLATAAGLAVAAGLVGRRMRGRRALGPAAVGWEGGGPVSAAVAAQRRYDRCGAALGLVWPASRTIREKAADLEAAGLDPAVVWAAASAVESAAFGDPTTHLDSTHLDPDADAALAALDAAVQALVLMPGGVTGDDLGHQFEVSAF
ncbi:MAG: transglutaminaseTgpA domain-containing protein [Acidimicrobiales bacterium]